jgi:hypothetical protein
MGAILQFSLAKHGMQKIYKKSKSLHRSRRSEELKLDNGQVSSFLKAKMDLKLPRFLPVTVILHQTRSSKTMNKSSACTGQRTKIVMDGLVAWVSSSGNHLISD